MVKSINMNKIIDYFYAFSKLTTSFVLMAFIFVLSYLLYTSYEDTDKKSTNIDNKLQKFSKEIYKNDENIKNILKKMIDRKNSIQEIQTSLDLLADKFEKKTSKNNDDEIKKLKISINYLENKINQISLGIKNNSYYKNTTNNKTSKDLLSLVKLIKSNYKMGKNIKKEIYLLEEMTPFNKKNIIEKLLILEVKKFNGLKSLSIEFNKSINHYAKNNFLNEKENIIKNFILKFITIKPSNLDEYQNIELNILKLAKNYIEKDDVQKSLDQIMLISNNDIYFAKWIDQANIYLDFISTINKVA